MSLFYENNSKTCKHWMYLSRLHWLNKVGNIQTVNWSVLILKIYILLILKEIFKIPSLSHYNIHTYTYIHIHIHSGIYIYLHTNWKYCIYTIRTIIVRNLLKFYSMLFEFSNFFTPLWINHKICYFYIYTKDVWNNFNYFCKTYFC